MRDEAGRLTHIHYQPIHKAPAADAKVPGAKFPID
jgi:hypothetical protein